AVANSDPRVRLLRQPNRGKARALQRGLAAMRTGIAVFLDADTHCQRNTLRRLVEPFSDETIGGVSGHAKVGNLRTFIARCQALEYTCGFNLDRRAYTRWNCMTVVPGAISAIRKSAIDDAGGLSLETLAEDTDLTLALHKQRQRIVYVPGAIAWTEAPASGRTLARQRSRWAYGTLQCVWTDRENVLRAWRILPMRLIYRPMLSYCIWKAILRAFKGAWVSWGKLERTASVPVRA